MIDNMTLNYSMIDIQSLVVDGIDTKGYPDFCDAHIISADYEGVPMNEDQLEELNENNDFVYNSVVKHLF
jgi:hypothetical protein